ncbi:MAG: methyl-accepting chemotaxis protein [Syntrophales bacterium]|nr:methyl-accepting chemotaxis protein [Syntrophales bacterium]
MIGRLFGNLKMWQKLLLAPLLVTLFMIGLSIWVYLGLNNQKIAVDDIYNSRFKAYQNISRIANDIANVHSNVYRVLSWANSNYEKGKIDALAKEQIVAIERNIKELQSILRSQNVNAEEKKLLQEAIGTLLEYQKPAVGVLDVASADVHASTMFMGVADEAYLKLNKHLEQLMSLEEKLSREKFEFSVKNSNTTMQIFIVVFALALVMSISLSIFVSRAVVAPIYRTIEVVQKVAEGDLTREIDLNSRDELGELARAVNTMRLKMGDAVGRSLSISKDLSESASHQASSLEETSAAMDQMASMIKQTADHTAEANSLMNAAKDAIQKANGSMNDLEQSMKVIASSSEKTQSIVKSIDEIAFQTNLLALNAAVEAARAGEAGAGFAVVADEVRNLAMRATESAKNTSGLIEDIVRKVKEGEKLVQLTSNAFTHVTDTSNKVMELISEIATASKEQSEGINQINRALADLNQVTQQNATNAQELAHIMSMFSTEDNKRQLKERPAFIAFKEAAVKKESAEKLIPLTT